MIVRWTAAATADLRNTLDYLRAIDPAMASYLAERVEEVNRNIAALPRAARYDAETGTYERYVPKTRIILVYLVHDEADEAEVIAAFHTSRDPAQKRRP